MVYSNLLGQFTHRTESRYTPQLPSSQPHPFKSLSCKPRRAELEVKRMQEKRMQDFRRWLYEALTTPEERVRHQSERVRHEAEQEEKKRWRVRKRLYRELAKKGLTPEQVDEGVRRVREVMGIE